MGQTGKLEAMHELSDGEIYTIVQQTVLFSHTEELKIPELANTETYRPEIIQDNGDSPPVNTQAFPPNSSQKTLLLPQLTLRHTPVLRLDMPLYKYARETSLMSASKAPAT